MTDPGLSNRLRQHSRRSGLMVGLSMAAAIAIFIGGFVGIYAATLPWLSDIVPVQARPRTPTPEPVAAPSGGAAADVPTPNAIVAAIQAAQTPTAVPAPAETAAPEPTETPEAFEPDFQITGTTINFRAGPSREDDLIQALPPATPLQYLNEEAPSTNPDDAPGWRRFRLESGEEGWVREIDTEPYRE